MASFFQNLYRYKQTDLKHQKENFITEILSYCLSIDKFFQTEFLKFIGCEVECTDFNCHTQHFDKEHGKPDLLIEFNDTIIVVECKVDAVQGDTQLDRYAMFLDKQKQKNRHLIFLTRFSEDLTGFKPRHNFLHIRWHDIFSILKRSDNLITKEFATYLNEQKMSRDISFTKTEVNALKNIRETISKMDDFLLHMKDLLERYTNNRISFLKKISNAEYGITAEIKIGNIWIGLFEYDHNEEVQVCIDLHTKKDIAERKAVDRFFDSNNWETYNEGEFIVWFNAKSMSTFFVDDTFDIKEASDFIKTELDKIKKWL